MINDADKIIRAPERRTPAEAGGKKDQARRSPSARGRERRSPQAPLRQNLREELIQAGIRELSDNGLKGFSVRRIAKECGVSCATPYKHFQDREGYMAAIFHYISLLWEQRQDAVLRETPASPREQLMATSIAYIRFLAENPYFRSIIMIKDDLFETPPSPISVQVSSTTHRLIEEYCRQSGLDTATAQLKIYIVRSLIYGASLMSDAGGPGCADSYLRMATYAIAREFDLPPAPELFDPAR